MKRWYLIIIKKLSDIVTGLDSSSNMKTSDNEKVFTPVMPGWIAFDVKAEYSNPLCCPPRFSKKLFHFTSFDGISDIRPHGLASTSSRRCNYDVNLEIKEFNIIQFTCFKSGYDKNSLNKLKCHEETRLLVSFIRFPSDLQKAFRFKTNQ